jgi:phospholipase C
MYQIDHVVVLMLENRSFDCMLGRLRPNSDDFDGVPPGAANVANGVSYPAWTSGNGASNPFFIPTPDPHEQFDHITAQIFGPGRSADDPSAADMSGFAADYASISGADPAAVMHGFTPEQLPVLSALANGFAVSDRWFASAPCQTWPNRFFAHTATARGYVNNTPIHPPYLMETVFNRLSGCDRSWRIYFHDLPQCATLTRLWSSLPEHLYSFEENFMADAMAGRLPNYSFIEPRYFADPLVNRLPNDQHPPHDVALGERLVARCYDAIRNGAGWERTLFIITFDEHGGIWDHVPPPKAVSPDGYRDASGFAFDRYGVRVPAVLVSPWIEPGTVLRPPPGGYPFDHTSIIATLNKLFGPFEPLTQRDQHAPDLLGCLGLSAPTNYGPRSIPLPAPIAAAPQIDLAQEKNATDAQNAMAAIADALPAGTANVPEHQEKLAKGEIAYAAAEIERTASDALAIAKNGLARFLHGTGAL